MQALYPDPHGLAATPFSSEVLKSVESQIRPEVRCVDGAKDV